MDLGTTRSTTLSGALVLVALLALGAACDGDPLAPDRDPDALRAAEGWELLEIEGTGGSVEPVQGPQGVPTLRFTDEDADGEVRQLGGDGGCNLLGGAYDADDDGSLEIHELVATDMACLEGGVMEVEAAFFDALSTVRAFRVTAGGLVLEFDGGSMTLAAVPAAGQ